MLKRLEQSVWDFCMAYAKSPSVGSLLVLYGNNGVGKTHSAKAIFRWAGRAASALPVVLDDAGHNKQPDAMYAHWPSFLDALKGGDWERVKEAQCVSLLVLDEIGGGYDRSQIGVDKLCTILTAREARWTIITTNLLPDAWEEALERRVASRMFRRAVHVDLSGVSDYSA